MIKIEKLPAPEIKTTLFQNKKAVYFGDGMLTAHCDSIEDECKEVIIEPLRYEGIEFKKIHCTEVPPFGQMTYNILFFDYGGMSMGNDCLGSFCRQIIREAEDFPSRYYVIVSTFTKWAMEDALKKFGKRDNIYLSLLDFADAFKKNEL